VSTRPGFVGLQVAAILDDEAALEVMRHVVVGPHDRLTIATDLSEGITAAQAEAPDIVFIDVGMSKGAALAVVHHLRAVVSNAVVYALARQESLQLGTQAIALGATGILMLPLSGDELITALTEVRLRHAERQRGKELESTLARRRENAELVGAVAELAEAPSRREAASRLAHLLVETGQAESAIVYLPAAEGSRQLMHVAHAGHSDGHPPFCDDMELLHWADHHDRDILRLALRRETAGIIALGGVDHGAETDEPFPLASVLATQAATCFALISAREQSHRGAMKDPSSSAYTFAYFVDVAGREIDRSRRHGRRFALATIGFSGEENNAPERGIEVVERVLGTVRATDVLARIDELEFYLLLPETGGIGAHVCRRRVMGQLRGKNDDDLNVTIGVATYPHNGVDLSQLLRVAKHRADAAHASVVHRLGLNRLELSEILDALLWDQAATSSAATEPEAPQTIELPAIDVVALATCALSEARRGGGARVVATLRPGVSVGAAIRAALGREASEVQADLIDISASAGCRDLEVLTLIAEHGSYLLLGRVERGHVRGVHASDPVLVDLVTRRLGKAARTRLVD
jgi:DNA-binding NarL/FixJ family response regulator/GGDEF domain-containing protein